MRWAADGGIGKTPPGMWWTPAKQMKEMKYRGWVTDGCTKIFQWHTIELSIDAPVPLGTGLNGIICLTSGIGYFVPNVIASSGIWSLDCDDVIGWLDALTSCVYNFKET